MRFKEIEFKYRAGDISLVAFTEFCTSRPGGKFIMASGYDFFYSNPEDKEGFGRHRIGEEFNQLTFKSKTVATNNFIRDEDNLDLAPGLPFDRSRGQADSFFSKFGYLPSGSVFKNCFIYKFHQYTLVYYVIYTEELQELDRFMEI